MGDSALSHKIRHIERQDVFGFALMEDFEHITNHIHRCTDQLASHSTRKGRLDNVLLERLSSVYPDEHDQFVQRYQIVNVLGKISYQLVVVVHGR